MEFILTVTPSETIISTVSGSNLLHRVYKNALIVQEKFASLPPEPDAVAMQHAVFVVDFLKTAHPA